MTPEAVSDLYVTIFGPLVGFLILYLVLYVLFEYLKRALKRSEIRQRFDAHGHWRSDQEIIAWLSNLSPTDFEIQVTEMFNRLGYHSVHNGKSRDKGVDILLDKNGRKTVVQCKRYSKKIGSPAIREFYGTIAGQLADDGLFVTNNYFTIDAQKEAEDKPIELIDGKKLVKHMKDAKMGYVPQDENQCPQCGHELVQKSGKYGVFIGCSSYPVCDFTRSI